MPTYQELRQAEYEKRGVTIQECIHALMDAAHGDREKLNELQEIRKDEKNYQIAGEEKYFQDAVAKIAALKDQADSIKALFDSEGDRQRIDRVLGQIANYETALTGYHDLEVKKGTALERMLQQSDEMERHPGMRAF